VRRALHNRLEYEEPSLKFHWPTNTRQVDLEVADFAKFGVVAKDEA
jgi:hypothetical protein